MVTDLKSEALKDRHWKELRKRLRLNVVMAELILGHIWDADLQRNEAAVKDVILVAQGEMALEEFLKQVRKMCSIGDVKVNLFIGCNVSKGLLL